MWNLVRITEQLEKECGFKYYKSSSKCIPHIMFTKEIGNKMNIVTLWNKSNDPKVKDWTIELQYGNNYPYELSFKAYELFREFIYAMQMKEDDIHE